MLCKGELFLESGRCVQTCEKASGYKKVGKKCDKCLVENCEDCDKHNSICKRCLKNYFLTEDNNCVSKCPEGHYVKDFNQKCFKCPTYCLKCDKDRNCLKCEDKKILFENKCVLECPIGYKIVLSEAKLTCEKNQGFDKCDEYNEKGDCLKCTKNYFLSTADNKCSENCPEGTFANKKDNICSLCSANCITCLNEKECLKCKKKFDLNLNKMCVGKCPQKTVVIDGKCVECENIDKHCNMCDKDSLNKCVQCDEGFYLDSNKCVSNCNIGYFANEKKQCQSNILVFFQKFKKILIFKKLNNFIYLFLNLNILKNKNARIIA